MGGNYNLQNWFFQEKEAVVQEKEAMAVYYGGDKITSRGGCCEIT